ncbi:MAG: translation initiation factor 1 [Spirosomataceae bacterium]|jgi:translation initiation factor 1
MSKKHRRQNDGIMYSTNKDFVFDSEKSEDDTLENSQQQLKVWLDKKGGGKVVTRVADFTGNAFDLATLKKELQSLCGSGGTAKDGEVLLQGDHRDKVVEYLKKTGHGAKKAGG